MYSEYTAASPKITERVSNKASMDITEAQFGHPPNCNIVKFSDQRYEK